MSHNTYNSLSNNHLHWFQKQRPTLSPFHASTPPQKLPKTPSSKQFFDLHPKTTRHFPQNDTLFSIKPHVTFYKTTRRFLGDEEISTPSAVTLVTAKNKTPSTDRAYTRAYTLASTTSPNLPLTQSSKSTPPLFRTQSPKTSSKEIINNELRLKTNTHLHYLNPYSAQQRWQNTAYKEKTAQICRFFTLWAYFYPYYNRG